MILVFPLGTDRREEYRVPVVTLLFIALHLGLSAWAQGRYRREAEENLVRLSGWGYESMNRMVTHLGKIAKDLEPFQGLTARRLAEIWSKENVNFELPSTYGFLGGVKSLSDNINAKYKEIRLGLEQRNVWRRYGFIPAQREVPEFLRGMFTGMLVHGSTGHLLITIFGLLLFGTRLEAKWGRLAFLLLYPALGAAAAFFFVRLGLHGDDPTPCLGASGALAGLAGVYTVHFIGDYQPFRWMTLFGRVLKSGTFHVPAFSLLPVFCLGLTLQHFLRLDAGGALGAVEGTFGALDLSHRGLDVSAYVGAFFVGGGLAGLLKVTGLERLIFPTVEVTQAGELQINRQIHQYKRDALYPQAAEAREKGEHREALALFTEIANRYPDLPGPWLELYEVHARQKDRERARHALIQAAGMAVVQGDRKLALEICARLEGQFPGSCLKPEHQLQVGAYFERDGNYSQAAQAYRLLYMQHPKDAAALKALFRYGEICRQKFNQPQLALAAFRMLVNHPQADPTWRSTLKEAIDQLTQETEKAEA